MHDQKKIQCLVADDEPPAREVIKRYIAELPMLQLAAECSNAVQVMSILQQQSIELIFLDINMPQLKGNELVKILKNPPKIIFTTAYPEYALEGYELDVVDFLLKPVQLDRFLKAVHKALHLNGFAANNISVSTEQKQESFVYFRAERKMVKVMLQDILYIESMKDYVKVYTTNGIIITKQSITSVEAMLPEHLFTRAHRSFIISLSKVKSFTSEVIDIDKTQIPIGKLFRHGVMKMLS
ncbi:MAG TPA: LytTR family DNA-binding domain-containing protein [Chitinophagaceae bacterium]|nr:LytTR family DNA-binding domain-containing protein [Chitinophagaceae bacterium]